MTQKALIKLLHKRKAMHSSWAALADVLGVSPQYLQDIKDGRREPGGKLLDGLGMTKVVSYVYVKEVAK